MHPLLACKPCSSAALANLPVRELDTRREIQCHNLTNRLVPITLVQHYHTVFQPILSERQLLYSFPSRLDRKGAQCRFSCGPTARWWSMSRMVPPCLTSSGRWNCEKVCNMFRHPFIPWNTPYAIHNAIPSCDAPSSRGSHHRTIPVDAHPFADPLRALHGIAGIPCEEQRLVYGGKQLRDTRAFSEYGIGRDSTLHLLLRLVGGKGGFGALLRSGARGSKTENFDACRDLSGRRLRHVNADKQLAGKHCTFRFTLTPLSSPRLALLQPAVYTGPWATRLAEYIQLCEHH